MLTECLKVVLEMIIKNHTYNFQNVIRKQKKGGAIGIDLTGTMARIFMSWWDNQLLQTLRQIGIEPFLYKRYEDDIDLGTEAIDGKMEYVNGELRERRNDEETSEPPDKRTFDIIKAIGNEIHSSIQLTTDVPSENEDGKVPILNLKCWIEEIDVGRHAVVHEHYIKNVSSKQVIHMESAISIKTKRTILTQMCLQVMLNCSQYLPEAIKNEHLSFFIARMQASGYDHEFRLEVLKSAKAAYEKIKQERRNEGTKMYRERTWNRNERRKRKEEKKKNWYKTGKYESVLFIQATPGSELRDKIQREILKNGVKIKVIEKSGTKLVRMLQRNDPFKAKECPASDCFVCRGENPGGCRDSGVTYRITCQGECQYEYGGQTGQNTYTRGKKHLSDLEKKSEESALWKHCVNVHQSEVQRFDMKVMDRCRNDPTKRQILEAVRIHRLPEDRIMNSRSEWNTTRIPRIQINSDVR